MPQPHDRRAASGPGGEARPDPGDADVLDREGLTEASVRGARSFAKWRVVYEITAIAALLALARLIPPVEIGHAAIALVLPMMAGIIAFEGFAGGLVVRQRVTPIQLRTSMTLSLTGGLILSAATAALGLLVLPSVFGSRTSDLIVLMSPVFLIACCSSQSRVVLQRRLDFARLSGYEAMGFVIGSAIAVSLAVAGVDAAAPVLGQLAGTILETSLVVAAAPPLRPGYNWRARQQIMGYGVYAASGGVLFALRRNADYIVLAGVASAREVGLYYRAFQIGGEYQGKVTGILQRILFPVLSRAESVEDRRHLRSRIVRLNSALVCPLLTLLFVGAPTLVPFLFGPQWSDAAEPTRALAVAGIALALMSGADVYTLALGRARAVLTFNALFLAAVAAVVFAVGGRGIVEVSIAVAALHVVMMLVAQVWLLGWIGGIAFRDFVADSAPALLSCLALAAASYPTYLALRDSVPAVVTLLGTGVIGLAAYALSLRLVFPGAWRLVRTSAMRMLSRRGTPTPAQA